VRSRRSVIATVVAAVVLLVLAGAWIYDHARRDEIAPGVRVAGVDVGGLSAAQARAKLERTLLRSLREPVVVRFGQRRFALTPGRARVAVNVERLVEQALARGREGFFVARAARELTGGEVDADVRARVHYSRAAVRAFVGEVTGALDRTPRDASLAFTSATLERVPARDGLDVNGRRLRRAVVRALRSGARDGPIEPSVRRTRPGVTLAQLADRYPTVITVNRSTFQLRLWKDLKLAKTYRIAVGQAGLETPAGRYTINDKQVNPSWHVPDSPWAGDLAGKVIPPGPDDPIKARWMGIYAGAGIHGTEDVGSLGSAASHGCIRMAIPDVIELYDRTPLGTTVYIV